MKTQASYEASLKLLEDWRSRQAGALADKIVLLYGESEYFLFKTLEFVRSSWLSARKQELDQQSVQSFDFSELSAEKFNILWSESDLFSESQLILFRRCEKKSDFNSYLGFIDPAVLSYKMLCFTLKTSSLTQKIQKEVDRLKIFTIPIVEPSPREIQKYLQEECRRLQLKIEPAALQLIEKYIGVDLIRLDNELKNLALLYSVPHLRDKVIRAEDLKDHLGVLREDHLFLLESFLTQRLYSKAQVLVFDLLKRGEPALTILSILIRHCRLALKVSFAKRKNYNEYSLASELKVPPFVVRNYYQLTYKVPESAFSKALLCAADADVRLKSSRVDEYLLLGNIVDHLSN